MEWYRTQIASCTYRQFTTGFFFGKPSEDDQIYDNNTYIKGYTYLGQVQEADGNRIKIEQKNKFSLGETIEIMKPDGANVFARVESIVNEEGEFQESAPHPKQILYVTLSQSADVYDILRREENENNEQDS